MLDRVGVVVVRLEPGRGAALQLRQPFGEGALRFEHEQIAEEVVVPEPLPGAVQADDELVPVGRGGQPSAPVGRPGDGVDERSGQPIEHGGLQESTPVVVGSGGEQLVAEVADDQLIVAPERLDEPGRISGPFERQAGEHQARGPSLGACAQLVDQGRRQRRRPQQRRRLTGGEAQVVGADLAQLVPHPQPAEAERWVDTRGDHQREFGRAQVDEALDATVHAVAVDQVVVVDHHDDPLVVDQFVHQRRHDHTTVSLRAGDERRQERRDARSLSTDRGDERRPEASGIGVAVLDLQPRHRQRLASGPRGEQRRLPRAGRRAHQNQRNMALDAVVDDDVEPGAFDESRRRCRRTKFGRRDSELVVQGHFVRP